MTLSTDALHDHSASQLFRADPVIQSFFYIPATAILLIGLRFSCMRCSLLKEGFLLFQVQETLRCVHI